MAYVKLGRIKEADALIKSNIEIYADIIKKGTHAGVNGIAGAYYDLGICHAYRGDRKLAIQYLDSASTQYPLWEWGWHNDPLLENIRNTTEFRKLLKRYDDYFEFRRNAFVKALNRSRMNKELNRLLDK